MCSRLFVLAIAAVLACVASAVAQQPKVQTRQQIEQMVATHSGFYQGGRT
jgi:hypothetical protein